MKFLACVFAMMLPFCAVADLASVQYTDNKVDAARGEIPVVNSDGTTGVAEIWIE